MLFRGHELNQEKAPGKVEREIHATVPDKVPGRREPLHCNCFRK